MDLTIAEVAERTGLTAHTLRYYERDGLLLGPITRDASGRRRYAADDLQWIEMIACLRSTGMGISGVRRYAELVRHGAGSESERLALLRAHREEVLAQMAVMTQHLGSIEYKIGLYEQTLGTRDLTSSALEGVGS